MGLVSRKKFLLLTWFSGRGVWENQNELSLVTFLGVGLLVVLDWTVKWKNSLEADLKVYFSGNFDVSNLVGVPRVEDVNFESFEKNLPRVEFSDL